MESYLQVNLLGPGYRLMKKRIYRGRVLTKFQKHWFRVFRSVSILPKFRISCRHPGVIYEHSLRNMHTLFDRCFQLGS